MTVGLTLSTISLRHKADEQHEADHRHHCQSLAVVQVRKADAVLRHGAAEDFLNHGEDDGRGDEQAEDRNRCRNPGQRKDAAEDEEFAEKAVEARQPERREERDAHEAGKHRRGLAQAAEVVDAAMAAGALVWSMAINQKSAAAVMPWLNICRMTPLSAAAWLACAGAAPAATGTASAKMPSRQ